MMHSKIFTISLLVFALALVACGSGEVSEQAPVEGAVIAVDMHDIY